MFKLYTYIYKESYFMIIVIIIYIISDYTNNEEGYLRMHDNQDNKNRCNILAAI